MIGIWVRTSDGYENTYVQKIYKSNGNYFIDYKHIGEYDRRKAYSGQSETSIWWYLMWRPDSLIGINSNYTSTHILNFPFFSEAYYESERIDKDYKPVKDKKIVKLIDKETILVGTGKYYKFNK